MGEAISNVAVIREYFTSDKWGRKVEGAELKALSTEEREELGTLCRAELQE